MNSESGKRYSMEALKRMNRPKEPEPAEPEAWHPTPEDWDELTERLELLESGTARILNLLSTRQKQEPTATREQMVALTAEVAALRTMLQPAGKKNGRHSSRRRLSTEDLREVLKGLLILPVLLGTGTALYAILSGSVSLWNAFRMAFP